ncbi:MAG: hypothetical protein U1F63_00435 [Chitinivorax sp.]
MFKIPGTGSVGILHRQIDMTEKMIAVNFLRKRHHRNPNIVTGTQTPVIVVARTEELQRICPARADDSGSLISVSIPIAVIDINNLANNRFDPDRKVIEKSDPVRKQLLGKIHGKRANRSTGRGGKQVGNCQ